MSSTEPYLEYWSQAFTDVRSSATDSALRTHVGVSPEAGDHELALGVIRTLSEQQLSRVGVEHGRSSDPRATQLLERVQASDSSILGRLDIGDRAHRNIETLDDASMLMALVRAGTLRQRRAALARTAQLQEGGKLESSDLEKIEKLWATLRDDELTYELSLLRMRMRGHEGREARADAEQWTLLARQVENQILAFWEGELHEEPVTALPADQRAQLLARTRLLSDVVVDHLCAVIEGMDGVSTGAARLLVLSSLRYAADRRLVPSLIMLLDHSDPEISLEAARALSRVVDPRVLPAFAIRYEHSVTDVQRAMHAAALGITGDVRGAEFVRGVLRSDNPPAVLAALEALESTGDAQDVERVLRWLKHESLTFVFQAVRTLARIGDSRALPVLEQVRLSSTNAALCAEIDEAEAAILARLELKGEEKPGPATSRVQLVRTAAAISAKREPALNRVLSVLDYVLGHLWFVIGRFGRGVLRLEAAASRWPAWVAPLLALGMGYNRRGQYSHALTAFRRALSVDRIAVEQNTLVMRALSKAFLRRAEGLEREGKIEIARGLLDEVLALDLRRAPSALRQELHRRQLAIAKNGSPTKNPTKNGPA